MNTTHGRIAAALAVTATFALASEAAASGYAVREQSPIAQGSSQAGAAARGDDPSFMFFNPAAIGWANGTVVSSGVSGILPSATTNSATATRAAILGGSPINGSLGGDAGYNAAVGNFAITTRLSDQFSVGVTGNAPFGLTTKYTSDYIGRYHAQTSTLRSYNITPVLAWRPLPNLVVAAGIQIQGLQARLSAGVDYGAAGATNPLLARLGFRPGAFDGLATTRGSSSADFGWTVGVQWEPISGTRVGLGFRSAILARLQGGAQFDGVPALLSTSPTFSNQPITAKVMTPEVLTFGLSHRFNDRWTGLMGAEWTNWSRFRELRIEFPTRGPAVSEERWHSTAFISLGGEYRVTPDLTLRAGIAWDQSPVPNSTRTPRIPDSNRYWLSAGATWQWRPNIAFTAAYTHVFADSSTIGLVDSGPTSTNFLRGNLTTTGSAGVNIVALGARLSF